MNFSAPFLLALIALILFVLAIIKPQWPLAAVGGILISIAVMLLAGK